MPMMPMLSDFGVRLASGLAILLLATPWRTVPSKFFQTHCQVILGLLVLSGLAVWQTGDRGPVLSLLVAASIFGYLASIAWGVGLPTLGVPLTLAIALTGGGLLVAASRTAEPEVWALNASGRLASAFLMGSTLTAMLLGHHYLTAPAMSILPLKRFVRGMAWGLGARAILAGLGLWFWHEGRGFASASATVPPLFLAIRWGMGIAGPALATYLAWKTVEIRSTQSATGILYIAMTLVLFGELSALIMARGAGVIF